MLKYFACYKKSYHRYFKTLAANIRTADQKKSKSKKDLVGYLERLLNCTNFFFVCHPQVEG